MSKALSGLVASALLLVGLSSQTQNIEWIEASAQHEPVVAPKRPSVHAGASDRRLPNAPPTAIRKVSCAGGWGTGVVISPDTVMTANHVVAGQTNCRDDETGEVFEITYQNASQDFAILRYPTTRHRLALRVQCDGYTAGSSYYAYGYAGVGTGDLAMFRMRATPDFAPAQAHDPRSGTIFAGSRILVGTIIPGMSGGPILDVEGRVVGINNATAGNLTVGLSREIKDTILCLEVPPRR